MRTVGCRWPNGTSAALTTRVIAQKLSEAWAQIEPSVSAFHLAFGPDDALYVTGPTVTSSDCVWRIDPDGEIDIFFKGLGRPQGLAFDSDGNLYVAASMGGRRGIVRIDPIVAHSLTGRLERREQRASEGTGTYVENGS